MPLLRGKDFKFWVYQDGIALALCHATDCTIPLITDEVETTGPNNGPFKTFRPTFHSYTIQVPALTVYTDNMNLVQLQKLQIDRTVFQWKAGIYDNGGLQYKGSAFITQTSPSHQFRDVMKFDVNMRGTGQLQIVEADIVKTVYLSDLSGIRLAGCPNPYPVTVLWYDGSIIGLANNPDDVVTQFNNYPGNQYYTLSSPDNSCNFTMTIVWNAPLTPDWVPAEQGGFTGLWTGSGDGGISSTEDGNELITPIETT